MVCVVCGGGVCVVVVCGGVWWCGVCEGVCVCVCVWGGGGGVVCVVWCGVGCGVWCGVV